MTPRLPEPPGVSLRLHADTRRSSRMDAWQPPAVAEPRSRLKLAPTTHPTPATKSASSSVRLNTVRPRATRCGRCVLTRTERSTLPQTAGTARETLRRTIDGPTPFMDAAIWCCLGGRIVACQAALLRAPTG